LVDADDPLGLTDEVETNFVFVDVEDIIGLTDEAEISAYVVLAANRVFFDTPYGEGGQDVQHNYIDIECSNEFAFQSLGGLNWLIDVRQYLGFTERYLAGEIGDNMGLTDTVRQAYLASATDSFNWLNHDDEDGPEYALVRAYKAVNEFAFTETVSFGEYQDVYQFLEFEDSISAENTEFGRPVESGFVRQHVAFRITGVNCPEKEYTPFVGESLDDTYAEVSVTPPTLGSGVFTLTYPRVSPTLTLTLKSPTFGNTDAVTFQRIDRVTRGGERKIYSDTDWGSWETLQLTIENICGTDIDEILTFLNSSLGKEIGLLDWENRTWRGFINQPDTDVIPQVGGFRVQITFEGELL
jgi:hypothetical protein